MDFDKNMYGETPESFKLLVKAAVKVDERPLVHRRRYVVIMACVLVLLLATTAIALTRSLGIFDVNWHMNTENGIDPATINTEVVQHGGNLQHVTFTARESMFDGHIAHVAIVQTPTAANTTAIDYSTLDAYPHIPGSEEPSQAYTAIMQDFIDAATVYGENIVAVDLWLEAFNDANGDPITLHNGYTSGRIREGSSILEVFTFVLPPDVQTDRVQIHLAARDGLPMADGGYEIYTESSDFVIELTKSLESEAISLDTDVLYAGLHINEITLRYTPYEMVLHLSATVIEGDVLSKSFLHFDENKAPIVMDSGAFSIPDENNHVYSFDILQASGTPMEILYLQEWNETTALKIDFASGNVEIVPALDSPWLAM